VITVIDVLTGDGEPVIVTVTSSAATPSRSRNCDNNFRLVA